jgi:hypothetical protein
VPIQLKIIDIEGKIDADAAPQPVLIRAVLKGCGFSVRSQDEVIRLLSCIMLLGNLEFAEDVTHRAEGKNSLLVIYNFSQAHM